MKVNDFTDHDFRNTHIDRHILCFAR